jgi:trans-L-3-hydroxyproline dehydratase
VPVAHRWTEGWDEATLSVIFEYRGRDPGPIGAAPQAPGAVGAQYAQPLGAAGLQPALQAAPAPVGPQHAQPSAAVAPPAPVEPQVIGGGPSAAPTAARPAASTSARPAASTSARTAARASAARAHARVTMEAIDLHCAGEPLRLIRSGYAAVPSAPILERRRWVLENADHLRRIAVYEPRGHRDMYGAVLLPPHRPDADIAVLFMHNEGYSTMCGHGVIAITTGLIEEGLFTASEPVTTIRYEIPAGLVTAHAATSRGPHGGFEVTSVRFENVPSYVASSGLVVPPDGLALDGTAREEGLRVDIAFGGAYYGIVDAADLGLRVVPSQVDALTRAGSAITDVLRRDHTPEHPVDRDLGFVYGTIIVDHRPQSSPDGRAIDADARNVTIFADGEVDRSPCGSGTSALLAQWFARGLVPAGRDIVNASITGEVFGARVEGETRLGEHDAVRTSVEGRAFVTGYPTLIVDDRDPLGDGFLLR